MTVDHPPEDHRSRVAAERRARMRDHLMRTGLALAADRGIGGFTIDDVVKAAEVSRGSFYKYYQTTEALVRDGALALAEELILAVNPLVKDEEDPARRLALGFRAVLAAARAHPMLPAFITRAGWPHAEPGHAFFRLVTPNLEAGMARGRFRVADPRIGPILVGGMTVGAMQALLTSDPPADFGECAAETLLIALGLPEAEARHLARLPYGCPPLPEDGLIRRTTAPGSTPCP